jgi:hypothetical protein
LDPRKVHHRDEVYGAFLEPHTDPPAFFQAANRLLDHVATLVGRSSKTDGPSGVNLSLALCGINGWMP